MVKGLMLAMAIAIAPGVTQGILPRPVSMNDLTVPRGPSARRVHPVTGRLCAP